MATTPNIVVNAPASRIPPADLVEDLQRVQKAAQRINSILDLDQLIESVVSEGQVFRQSPNTPVSRVLAQHHVRGF